MNRHGGRAVTGGGDDAAALGAQRGMDTTRRTGTVRRLAVLVLLLLPASAPAATRYVATGGIESGGCERLAPCTPGYAIAGAGSLPGDTVVVAPGRYDVAPLVISRPLLVTSRPDAPRPVLRASEGVALTIAPDAAGAIVEHMAVRSAGAGSLGVEVQAAAVLDDVRVTTAGAPCLRSDATGVRIERSDFALAGPATVPCVETTGNDTTWEEVTVTAPGGATAAAFSGNGMLTDVTATGHLTGLVAGGSPEIHRVTATGAEIGLSLEEGDALVTDSLAIARRGGTAVRARRGDHHLVNVTAWAAGRFSAGIRAVDGADVVVKNTIARGRVNDLVAEPATTEAGGDCDTAVGCPAGTIVVDHSNFRRGAYVVDNGANQAGGPGFVAAGRGDFRLRRRSPAVDAGSFEINAASADRAGRFRWLGMTPDLGAFEYAPPRSLAPRSDRRAPVLRAVALSTPRLPVVRRGTAFSAAARRAGAGGALLRWFVSEKSDIVITVRRPGAGRPVVGTIVAPAALGWGSLRLNGRLDARPLPRGRYLLRIIARDVTQNLSAPRDFSVSVG